MGREYGDEIAEVHIVYRITEPSAVARVAGIHSEYSRGRMGIVTLSPRISDPVQGCA